MRAWECNRTLTSGIYNTDETPLPCNIERIDHFLWIHDDFYIVYSETNNETTLWYHSRAFGVEGDFRNELTTLCAEGFEACLEFMESKPNKLPVFGCAFEVTQVDHL